MTRSTFALTALVLLGGGCLGCSSKDSPGTSGPSNTGGSAGTGGNGGGGAGGAGCSSGGSGSQEVVSDSARKLMWRVPLVGGLYQQAQDGCACEYAGYSDWALPTISQLRGMIQGCPDTEPGGGCGVTDSCNKSSQCIPAPGTACDGCATTAGHCYWDPAFGSDCATWSVWSATPDPDYPNNNWVIMFDAAGLTINLLDPSTGYSNYTCVRVLP